MFLFDTNLIWNGLFRRSPLCLHYKKQICLILLFTLISIQFRADLQFHLDEGQSTYISSVTSSTIHVTIMVTIDSNFISFFQKVEYLFWCAHQECSSLEIIRLANAGRNKSLSSISVDGKNFWMPLFPSTLSWLQ